MTKYKLFFSPLNVEWIRGMELQGMASSYEEKGKYEKIS